MGASYRCKRAGIALERNQDLQKRGWDQAARGVGWPSFLSDVATRIETHACLFNFFLADGSGTKCSSSIQNGVAGRRWTRVKC